MRPAVNIKRKEELVELFIALPGIAKDEINLNVENGLIMISTDAREDDSEDYIRKGFDYSGMEWKFQLPKKTNVESIGAELKDGILAISMPQVIVKKQIKVA